MIWAAEAWADVSQGTIVNCWRKVGILPQVSILGTASEAPLGELQQLLLDFSQAMGEPPCTMEDCAHIDGEDEVQDPAPGSKAPRVESCAAGVTAEEAEEAPSSSEEPRRHLSLREARQSARDLLFFCADNQEQRACNKASELFRQGLELLESVMFTSRHVQTKMDRFCVKE